MESLKTIRNRIRSVGSTQKITKAMKMVAAARFRRAQNAVVEARPYARKMEELAGALVPAVPKESHPLLGDRPVKKRILVALTSDRGLCGSFNANILRRIEKEMDGGIPTVLLPLGKKVLAYATRRRLGIHRRIDGFWHGFGHAKAAALAAELARDFEEGGVDRVDLLFNEFVSVLTQKPGVVPLLPVAAEGAPAEAVDPVFEPGRDAIVAALIPKIVEMRFYGACLNSLASEHGARMTAMDSATRNAEEMIDTLTLKMNRARQTAITKELMEIVGGAEALK